MNNIFGPVSLETYQEIHNFDLLQIGLKINKFYGKFVKLITIT